MPGCPPPRCSWRRPGTRRGLRASTAPAPSRWERAQTSGCPPPTRSPTPATCRASRWWCAAVRSTRGASSSTRRGMVTCRAVLLLASATVTLAVCGPAPPPTAPPPATPPAPPDWKLVWHDELDGAALDLTKWVWEAGGGGWGNNELEFYTARPENARVEKGNPVIEPR